MKKKRLLSLLVIALLVMFSNILIVNADRSQARIIATDGVNLREGPTTEENNKLINVPYNDIVYLLEEGNTGKGCSDLWYKVTYGAYTGYVCSTYFEIVVPLNTTKVRFNNHSVVIPKKYDYSLITINSIAVLNDTGTIGAFVGVENYKYDDVKTNVSSLLGDIIINSMDIKLTRADVSTIEGEEYIIINGTASSSGFTYNFDYYLTKKEDTENTVSFGLVYENGVTEAQRLAMLKQLSSTFKTETTEETSAVISNMTDEEFEEYLTAQGFPESYKVKIRELHKKHPAWIFVGSKTGYTWKQAMIEQDEFSSYWGDDSPGRSFLNINPGLAAIGYEGYLSTQPNDYDYYTDTFKPHDGKYWFQANYQTIATLMDPRYYLTEHAIFTFQDLTYDRSYQNIELVKQVLGNNHLTQFAEYFMEAAEQNNTSPIYLAALSRLEVGTSSSNVCSNGQAGVLSDGVDYTGFYNFYNIGASSSDDPKLKSLQFAMAAGWNSAQKAIVNGAYRISVNYIQCGQNTTYYQKYNFSPNATKGLWHQYTTNIDGLETQSISAFNSYNSLGVLDLPFKFDIPIFDDMPDSTPLPNMGNPNNYLYNLTINNIPVTNFDGGITDYTINIPYAETVDIGAYVVAPGKSQVTGMGTLPLNSDSELKQVIVTAQNGATRTYNITIVRAAKPEPTPTPEPTPEPEPEPTPTPEPKKLEINEIIFKSGYLASDLYLTNVTYNTGVEQMISYLKTHDNTIAITVKDKNGNVKSSGTIVTGDRVEFNTGSESKVLTVCQYGDTSGDGVISAIDLLNVQKIILGKSNLTGAFLLAADTNKDGNISAIDLLNVQKHILGKYIISQN